MRPAAGSVVGASAVGSADGVEAHGGGGAPSAEIPRGSVDVNILRSAGLTMSWRRPHYAWALLWIVGGERQKP